MSHVIEAVTEGGEDVAETMEVLQSATRESTLLEDPIDPATETSSARVPYLGEDARMTQLRQFDDVIREIAAKPSECPTMFPPEILRFLPSMTRAWIQMIGELIADKGNAQVENEALQAEDERIHERISSLLEQNGKLDDKIIQLHRQNTNLGTTINKVVQDLANMRKERDLLQRKLEEIQIPPGFRAESDEEGRTKKRNREN